MGIALTPAPALIQDRTVTLLGQIEKLLPAIGVKHDRPRRNIDHNVIASRAAFLAPSSGTTVLRKKTLLHLKMRQRFYVFPHKKNDVATTTTVSPVGTTFRYVFFAPEGYRTGTTMSGPDMDFRLI